MKTKRKKEKEKRERESIRKKKREKRKTSSIIPSQSPLVTTSPSRNRTYGSKFLESTSVLETELIERFWSTSTWEDTTLHTSLTPITVPVSPCGFDLRATMSPYKKDVILELIKWQSLSSVFPMK